MGVTIEELRAEIASLHEELRALRVNNAKPSDHQLIILRVESRN